MPYQEFDWSKPYFTLGEVPPRKPPEVYERYSQFHRLRDETHEEIRQELEERKRTHPTHTPIEADLDAYIEELEPQVRDAVVTFNRKGYLTWSSGFVGVHSDLQYIIGYFTLDNETIERLAAIEVDVEDKGNRDGRPCTAVYFHPEEPDLDQMKAKWDVIAEMLPELRA